MIGDAGEDVGEPGLGVDGVEATSFDERVQGRGATAAGVGAGAGAGAGEQILFAIVQRSP